MFQAWITFVEQKCVNSRERRGAWSTIFTHRMLKSSQASDIQWLERSFHKLLLNFTWWVNRKDPGGRNAFEGGFLGLDNIGVFDRSSPLPTGGYLEQADGTAWMALFSQNMLEIAMELARYRPAYAEMCDKFFAHYLWIAASMAHTGDDTGMWDEEDGFFYDVLKLPDGRSMRLKVRSMVGLLPLCATTVFDGSFLTKFPEVADRVRAFLRARPELRDSICRRSRKTAYYDQLVVIRVMTTVAISQVRLADSGGGLGHRPLPLSIIRGSPRRPARAHRL